MRPLAEKQANIAAFISNCGAKSVRLQALEMLNTSVAIDSYGRCMHNKETAESKLETLMRYKFSLAFENSQVPCCACAHSLSSGPLSQSHSHSLRGSHSEQGMSS